MDYRIDRILYASDLGPSGTDIARHAVGIARRFGATVHVVHVLEPVKQFSDSVFRKYAPEGMVEKLQRRGIDEAREEFERRALRFFEANSIAEAEMRELFAGIEVVRGSPAKAILAEAKRIDADLIVLGDRGYSALDEMLIGSVAHKVMLASKRPVLLVPISA